MNWEQILIPVESHQRLCYPFFESNIYHDNILIRQIHQKRLYQTFPESYIEWEQYQIQQIKKDIDQRLYHTFLES